MLHIPNIIFPLLKVVDGKSRIRIFKGTLCNPNFDFKWWDYATCLLGFRIHNFCNFFADQLYFLCHLGHSERPRPSLLFGARFFVDDMIKNSIEILKKFEVLNGSILSDAPCMTVLNNFIPGRQDKSDSPAWTWTSWIEGISRCQLEKDRKSKREKQIGGWRGWVFRRCPLGRKNVLRQKVIWKETWQIWYEKTHNFSFWIY